MITDRDIHFLQCLARYRVMSFRQVWKRCYPTDKNGRITRRRIAYLLGEKKLINKTRMEVTNPNRESSACVFYPSKAGCELLAIRCNDMSFLSVPYTAPQWHNLAHWQVLTDVHCVIEDTVARQSMVTMPVWFNEFDVVNKDADNPADKHALYTVIRMAPKLVCVPDAAFLLAAGPVAKAYYIELECGSNSPQKAAAEKTPGYAGLAAQQLHRRHFPSALDTFNVLMFAPTPSWRDALRKAISKKERPDLWRIASMTDVKAETFLTAPIFYPVADEPPLALLKTSAPVSVAVSEPVSVH